MLAIAYTLTDYIANTFLKYTKLFAESLIKSYILPINSRK